MDRSQRAPEHETAFAANDVIHLRARNPARSAIDVLKIDTESYDLEILKTVDFSRISPSLILVEHANISRNDKIAMADILLKQGYKVGMTSLDMLGYKETS